VVLALSDEGVDLVEPYVEKLGLTLRVGMSSRTNGLYGVSGIPHSVLIDPQGRVVWRGHPGSLSDGKVEDALKGARKPAKVGYLAFTPSLGDEHAAALEASAPLRALVEQARAGELAKLLAGLENFDARADAGLETARGALADRAKAHTELLAQQAEAAVKRLDVAAAIEVYGTLAKVLAGRPEGEAATKRLAEIRADKELAAELAAAEAFERTRKSAERLATSKQRKKFEEFAEKYPGTRAGRRAAALASAKN